MTSKSDDQSERMELSRNSKDHAGDNGQRPIGLQSAFLGKQIPSFLNSYIGYYEFIGREDGDRNRPIFVMKCLLCPVEPKKDLKGKKKADKTQLKDAFIRGKDSSAFKRHLERFHPDTLKNIIESVLSVKQQSTLNSSVIGSFKSTKADVIPYSKENPIQSIFEKNIIDWVTDSSVPFSAVTHERFKAIFASLDPRLTIPSRSTVVRRMSSSYESIMNHVKMTLREMPYGTLHLILDLWSSKQKMSVIGIKIRFIKNWKLQTLTIGFKHFPEKHSGENIRKTMEDFISALGLTRDHFSTITGDNAANILSAFNIYANQELEPFFGSQNASKNGYLTDDLVTKASSDNESIRFNAFEDNSVADKVEAFEELDLCSSLDSRLFSAISMWSTGVHRSLRRNSCLVHLLQLAVRDALKCKVTEALAIQINKIVSWFHKTNHYYTKVRQLTGELGLARPCETRWNSVYLCFKRFITETKDKDLVVDKVNQVLREAKAEKKYKAPAPVYDQDVAKIKFVVAALEPFALLTDELQSDEVTSSLVIIGLVQSLTALSNVEVDQDIEEKELLELFKGTLMKSVIERFGTPATDGKVTLDVFNDASYILASLVDPRFKTAAFQGKFDISLPNGIVDEQHAVELLKGELQLIDSSNKEVSIQPLNVDDAIVDLEPPPKKRRPLFQFARKIIETNEKESPKKCDELDEYLGMNYLDIGENPLRFWAQNEHRFPILSQVAKKYLSLPASSASVERLFSVAGAIARSRRSRILIENMEKILCYKDYLRCGLGGLAI